MRAGMEMISRFQKGTKKEKLEKNQDANIRRDKKEGCQVWHRYQFALLISHLTKKLLT